jgi:outer membrane protein assembly factor BamE
MLMLSTTACSSWVYRYDIPQGNYLEQKDIDKLQIQMTKEQVKFVLGNPVVVDSFDDSTWHYVYKLKSGRSSKYDTLKSFKVYFENNLLVKGEGDFEVPESFYTPMEN